MGGERERFSNRGKRGECYEWVSEWWKVRIPRESCD